MITLTSLANGQKCEFVTEKDGFICLRMDYVMPKIRWFKLSQIEAVTLPATVAAPPQPAPLTVVLTPELAAHVNASALVSIVVRKPVTLYSEWLKVA